MNVEIIAVGTELLLGEIANTDAQDISQGLAELGFGVLYHTVVGDNPQRLRAVLETALSRADVLITTGGLGPTYDDLTKEVCAEVFDAPLELHGPSIEKIRSFFNRLGRKMTPNNEKQAWLPRGCTVFENDWGTAPGCAMEKDGRHLLMLPGPPRECRPMFRERGMPYLARLAGGAIHSDWIRVFGLGESAMEDKLRDLMEHAVNPSLAPYAKDYECMVRVTARADSDAEAAALNKPFVEKVCAELGDAVYGVNVESLEAVAVESLAARGLTLACAESCTGGLLSKRITDVPGASRILLGGVCAYANSVKTDVLDVPASLLKKHGAVSAPVAVHMARGVRRLTGADVGVGITGIAGPGSDGSGKPVGLVYIAISRKTGGNDLTFVRELRFNGNRERIRLAASSHALDLLRKLP